MGITQLLKGGVKIALDYVAYPTVALAPGKVQPWLFSKLPYATDLASRHNHLDPESRRMVVSAPVHYSNASGYYELLLAPFAASTYLVYSLAAASTPDLGMLAASVVGGLVDGVGRAGNATIQHKPFGLLEGLVEEGRILNNRLADVFKGQ